TVTLAASPATVLTGSSSTLTAMVTLLNGATAPTSFDWDCNNDGTVDATTAINTTSCAYPTAGTITSKVTVSGSASASATTTVTGVTGTVTGSTTTTVLP